MFLYARQLGYYHAVPKDWDKSRLENALSIDSEYAPIFPPLSEESYLISMWERVGFATGLGMGRIPLTWSEINNWLQATGTKLSTWEVETISTMSRMYVSEANNTEVSRPMPYVENSEQVQQNLNRQFTGVFNKLKQMQREVEKR